MGIGLCASIRDCDFVVNLSSVTGLLRQVLGRGPHIQLAGDDVGAEAAAHGRADHVSRVGPASPVNVPILPGKRSSRFIILSALWHKCFERTKTQYAKSRTYPTDEGGLYRSKVLEHLTRSVYVGTIEAEYVGNAGANRAGHSTNEN